MRSIYPCIKCKLAWQKNVLATPKSSKCQWNNRIHLGTFVCPAVVQGYSIGGTALLPGAQKFPYEKSMNR